jgi:hypothetical protein
MLMDEKFLEFWGNLLINAARSKKQTDDFFSWMKSGGGAEAPKTTLPGTEEMAAAFRRFYGLDKVPEKGEDYNRLYRQSLEDFHKSFKDYLGLMGIVPREEHLALVKKYETLKERCAEQEETIRHLKMLLAANKNGRNGLSDQFQDLVKNQSELFQQMMSDFGQCFTRSGDPAEDETSARNKGERSNDQPNAQSDSEARRNAGPETDE